MVVEKETMFVYDVYVSFRQKPLTRLSKRQRGRLHDLLRKILANAVPLCFYI